MIKRKTYIFIWACTITLLVIACNTKDRSIPVSDINIQSTLFRFDEFASTQKNLHKDSLAVFFNQYPEFSKAYNKAILRKGELSYSQALENFEHYFDSIGVNRLIQERYTNFSNYQKQITKVQKQLKASITDFNEVDVITMNSGFNYKNFLLKNSIAIGLDMYLGDSVQYTRLGRQFPRYKEHTFTPNYLVPDVAETLIRDFYPDTPENNTLLSKMIHEGKILWLKSLVVPKSKDYVIIKYKQEDWQWCKENERNIWRYFISEELLYSRDYHQFKTYVNDGPFSSGMPKDSPANTGSFIGWQIIKHYAQSHPNESIGEIFNTQAQTILEKSEYKP